MEEQVTLVEAVKSKKELIKKVLLIGGGIVLVVVAVKLIKDGRANFLSELNAEAATELIG